MTTPNQDQIDQWAGPVGEKWAAHQARMDAFLGEVTRELKSRAGSVSGLRMLDIGCGSGTTVQMWLDGGAEVTGVDVSTPMLALAFKRTGGKARLIEADASVWRDPSGFDLVVSQFGVMFFDDPEAAFVNIAANVRPGGRLLFACWRTGGENPWATAPLVVARELVGQAPPPPPPVPPPGPFAFADKGRLTGILDGAGFTGLSIQPFDFKVHLADAGGLDAAVDLTMEIGPASATLREAGDAEALKAAPAAMAKLLAPYEKDGAVLMPGAIWIVEARKPQAG